MTTITTTTTHDSNLQSSLIDRIKSSHEIFVTKWKKPEYQTGASRREKWDNINDQMLEIASIISSSIGVNVDHIPGWWSDNDEHLMVGSSTGFPCIADNDIERARVVLLHYSPNQLDNKKYLGTDPGRLLQVSTDQSLAREGFGERKFVKKDYHVHFRDFYDNFNDNCRPGAFFVTFLYPILTPYKIEEQQKNDAFSIDNKIMLFYLRQKLLLLSAQLVVVVGNKPVRPLISTNSICDPMIDDNIFREQYSKEPCIMKLETKKANKGENAKKCALIYCPHPWSVFGEEVKENSGIVSSHHIKMYENFINGAKNYLNPVLRFSKRMEKCMKELESKKDATVVKKDVITKEFKDVDTGEKKIDISDYIRVSLKKNEKVKMTNKEIKNKEKRKENIKKQHEKEARLMRIQEKRKQVKDLHLPSGEINAFRALMVGAQEQVKQFVNPKKIKT